MKHFLLRFMIAALLVSAGCRGSDPPAAEPDDGTTLPLTVIREATDSDAAGSSAGTPFENTAGASAGTPAAMPSETPTGRVYDSSTVVGQTYALADILDFSIPENAAKVTVTYRGTGTGGRTEEWDRDGFIQTLAALKPFTVTALTAEGIDLASFPTEKAAFIECAAEDGSVSRFSVLKTVNALYFSFDWTLLKGESLDDPGLLFRLNGEYDGIFPEA